MGEEEEETVHSLIVGKVALQLRHDLNLYSLLFMLSNFDRLPIMEFQRKPMKYL